MSEPLQASSDSPNCSLRRTRWAYVAFKPGFRTMTSRETLSNPIDDHTSRSLAQDRSRAAPLDPSIGAAIAATISTPGLIASMASAAIQRPIRRFAKRSSHTTLSTMSR